VAECEALAVAGQDKWVDPRNVDQRVTQRRATRRPQVTSFGWFMLNCGGSRGPR